MSGFIHIAHKTPAWQKALRGAGALAVIGGIAWYALSDDGLPVAPANSATAKPFVKAQPLPAPAPLPQTAQAQDDDDTRDSAAPKTAARLMINNGDDDDFATRNASIDIQRLTSTRPQTARTFLSEVLVTQGPQAGFVVAEVLPESRFERMGLRPGDVIYSLDIPGAPAVDENSMIALMQQTELSLDVYRNGTLTRLRTNLAAENADAPTR